MTGEVERCAEYHVLAAHMTSMHAGAQHDDLFKHLHANKSMLQTRLILCNSPSFNPLASTKAAASFDTYSVRNQSQEVFWLLWQCMLSHLPLHCITPLS